MLILKTSCIYPFQAPKTLHPNVIKYPQCGFPTNQHYETISDYPILIGPNPNAGTNPPLLVAPNPMGGLLGSHGSMPTYFQTPDPMDVWNYWNDYYDEFLGTSSYDAYPGPGTMIGPGLEKSGPKFKNGDQPMGGYDADAVNEYAHCMIRAGGQAQDPICPEQIGDHKCHEFLNTPECGFDEGDCCEEDLGNDVEETCYGCVCYESEFSQEPSSEYEFSIDIVLYMYP